jgi:hypothetical protein
MGKWVLNMKTWIGIEAMKKLFAIALTFIVGIGAVMAQAPNTTKPSLINMLTANCTAAQIIVGSVTSPVCGPTAVNAGDVVYFNGTNFVVLAGNASGTKVLQETSAGVPSWAAAAGTGTVTSVTCFGTAITVSGTCTTTGQIPGEPSTGSASAGNIGEIVDGTVALSSVSLSTGTAVNLTSISLTAGDWEVYSTCYYTPNTATTVSNLQCSTNTTTATIDATPGAFGEYALNSTVLSSSGNIHGVSPGQPKRYSLSTTTTVFLVSNQVFGVSTLLGGGKIHAIRER